MKLKNIIAYIKRKQFYFALFTCCVTLFLIAILVWVKPKEDNKEIANLNGDVINNEETMENLTSNLVENDETGKEVANEETMNEEETVETSTAMNPITISTEDVIGEGDSDEENAQIEEPVQEKPKEVVIEIAPVVKPNISFNAKEKMIWPVSGSILIPYSIDTPVYFETLDQYKVNSALYIASDIGNEVKVATEGIVETIEEEPETGITVTVYHGNGYKTVYGQLKKQLLVKEGDLVKKGQVLGNIETPTKYHVLLAPHLYFKVTNNEEPVNPADMIE